MDDDKKLPDSLTLATKVLPPGQEEDICQIGLVELVGRMNRGNKIIRKVINESGNGRRFEETRDRVMQNVLLGRKPDA